ncbi:MAG: redoxin domain-containing protein [Muribaculaceae bacterium]|nr:redoxin domain-containing protein [Muribaculaceae bacterium]
MKKTILLIIIFVGVLVCAVGYADSKYRTSIGRPAPALWLPADGDAPETTLSENRGHYVLLNFWNSTDAASRRAANTYTAWLRAHPGTDTRLLSVNVGDNEALYREIVRRDRLIDSTQHHLGDDLARAVSDSYGLKDGLGTVLIDPSGRIIAHNPSECNLPQ